MSLNGKHIKNDKNNVKNNTRKKCIFIIAIVIIALGIASGVYAYLTYKMSIKNTVSLGYNKISLNEIYEPPLNMEKGTSFVKEPYVTNIGNVDCYVRIKSVVSDSRVSQYLTINYNTEDFTYNNADGYWYYKNVLKPGEKSKSLFTKVSIADDVDDIVLEGFDIYVYAESVQSESGKSSEEMWNYFENK